MMRIAEVEVALALLVLMQLLATLPRSRPFARASRSEPTLLVRGSDSTISVPLAD